LKWLLTIVGAAVSIGIGVPTLITNWKNIFPPKIRPQAGLTVMVTPSAVDISPNGKATVTWTLAETNKVGINITSRTGEWQTTVGKVVKTIGPIQTLWRIEPFGRRDWTDPIILYDDAANEAADGYLILDQSFQGQDDNGHGVVGKARVRVRLIPYSKQ
jgi:hypothetical protein